MCSAAEIITFDDDAQTPPGELCNVLSVHLMAVPKHRFSNTSGPKSFRYETTGLSSLI